MTATATATATPPTPTRHPLWPQPIEVIGFSGEFASGKTLAALTIAPGPDTLCYDNEKSSGTYQSLGFHRVDVPAEMLRLKPAGYRPIDTFEWWLQHVRAVPPGKYRVIVLDPVSEIESGLADWVRTHPGQFGRTTAQYIKMSGVMWGDVKEYWKSILSDLSSRCETFAFTSHMTSVWQNNEATGKRKVKGKETLEELASLYLVLERKKDAKGNVPAAPAGVVKKSRLSSIRVLPDGQVQIVPTLPPRLPVATPTAIRQYMATPPDYSHLKPEELAPEASLTDDDRLELRAQISKNERETEEMRLARQDREQRRGERVQPAAAVAATPTTNGTTTSPPPTEMVNGGQLAELSHLRASWMKAKGIVAEDGQAIEWSRIVGLCGVTSAKQLTNAQANDLIYNLSQRLHNPEGQPPPPSADSFRS